MQRSNKEHCIGARFIRNRIPLQPPYNRTRQNMPYSKDSRPYSSRLEFENSELEVLQSDGQLELSLGAVLPVWFMVVKEPDEEPPVLQPQTFRIPIRGPNQNTGFLNQSLTLHGWDLKLIMLAFNLLRLQCLRIHFWFRIYLLVDFESAGVGESWWDSLCDKPTALH